MRASNFFFVSLLLVLGSSGCSRLSSPATRADAPISPTATTGQPQPSSRTTVASWEPGAGEATFFRHPGERAPPLVIRGIVRPTNVTGVVGGACEPLVGARAGTPAVVLNVGSTPRTLYVFARARGPIGLGSMHDRCETAGPNAWARLVLPQVSDDVTIVVADVDFDDERRGQTSPYVLVVSEEDIEPTHEPDRRAPLPPDTAIVRWNVAPAKCPLYQEHHHCLRAAIELSGAVSKSIPLKSLLNGQLDCFPSDTGAFCGGASGATVISLEPSPDGLVEVRATSEGDGYCPPPNDCATRETLLTFRIRPGIRLVPDPAGTWPPRKR